MKQNFNSTCWNNYFRFRDFFWEAAATSNWTKGCERFYSMSVDSWKRVWSFGGAFGASVVQLFQSKESPSNSKYCAALQPCTFTREAQVKNLNECFYFLEKGALYGSVINVGLFFSPNNSSVSNGNCWVYFRQRDAVSHQFKKKKKTEMELNHSSRMALKYLHQMCKLGWKMQK